MKPYSKSRKTKGISGLRRSKDTPHRRRCLRVDKKSARQQEIWENWQNIQDVLQETQKNSNLYG